MLIDVEANTARYRADEVDAHLARLVRVLDALTSTRHRPPSRWPTSTCCSTASAPACSARRPARPAPRRPSRSPPGSRRRSTARPTRWRSSTATARSPTRELDGAANRLARALLARGVGRGDVVALALPRIGRDGGGRPGRPQGRRGPPPDRPRPPGRAGRRHARRRPAGARGDHRGAGRPGRTRLDRGRSRRAGRSRRLGGSRRPGDRRVGGRGRAAPAGARRPGGGGRGGGERSLPPAPRPRSRRCSTPPT